MNSICEKCGVKEKDNLEYLPLAKPVKKGKISRLNKERFIGGKSTGNEMNYSWMVGKIKDMDNGRKVG